MENLAVRTWNSWKYDQTACAGLLPQTRHAGELAGDRAIDCKKPVAGDSQSQAAESPSLSNERDIAAEKKALLNESTDLEEMAKSLKGAEFDAALQLDQ